MLEIKNLHVNLDKENKKIIENLNLNLKKGKVYALMGPNGSGKSTLANVIMGNPKYQISKGEIRFNNKKINNMDPDKRAKLGIYLSFQYPQEISGVSIYNFLKQALKSKNKDLDIMDVKKIIEKKAKELEIKEEFLQRYLNEGFSGGEKKKSEILQLLVLNPNLVILDETDSGLDIDAIRIVSKGINKFIKENKDKTVLVITHYKRILDYIKPEKVFVMYQGRIIFEGKKDILNKLEKKGYKDIIPAKKD